MNILTKLRNLTRRSTLVGNDLIHVYSPSSGKDHYVLLNDLLVVTGGYPDWNSTAAAAGDYDINSKVTYGYKTWNSLIDNNPDLPVEGASWTEVSATVIAPTLPANMVIDCGNHDASTNLFPTTGGTGTAGAIKRGNQFDITVAGTLGGVDVEPGATVRAKVDTPGQTLGNWVINY